MDLFLALVLANQEGQPSLRCGFLASRMRELTNKYFRLSVGGLFVEHLNFCISFSRFKEWQGTFLGTGTWLNILLKY